MNGLTGLAVTKIDVLDGLEKIMLCVAYEHEGKRIIDFPPDIAKLEKCVPIYEEFPGWMTDLSQAKSYYDLPLNTKHYLDRISQIAEAKISLISVGAEREQIIKI